MNTSSPTRAAFCSRIILNKKKNEETGKFKVFKLISSLVVQTGKIIRLLTTSMKDGEQVR